MSEESIPSIQSPGSTPKPEASVAESAPMAATGEATATDQPLLAGKYKSVEDLEKGYTELQKTMSSKPDYTSLGIDELLEKAGVNGGDLAVNWSENKSLTEDQYSALGKVGLGKAVVDQFLHGQQAIAEGGNLVKQEAVRVAAEIAGGETELNNLVQWAGSNYPDQQITRLQAMLDDPTQMQAAVKEMMFDWQRVSGRGFTEQLVTGQSMPNTSAGFTNVSEFVEAMTKARESGFDAAFRRRLANTPEHITRGIDR